MTVCTCGHDVVRGGQVIGTISICPAHLEYVPCDPEVGHLDGPHRLLTQDEEKAMSDAYARRLQERAQTETRARWTRRQKRYRKGV